MRSIYVLVCSWIRVERADWHCTSGWLVSHKHPGVCPSLSQASIPILLASCSTLDKGCQDWEKSSAVIHRGSLNLKWHLSRAGEAITGTYTGSASKEALTSLYSWTTTTYTPHTHQQPTWVIPALWQSSTPGQANVTEVEGRD